MVNYQDSKIYRIVCNITNKTYIGSTTTSLCQRLAKHRHSFAFWKRGDKNSFTSSFEILENEDFDIVLIEEYPCETKEQLHFRERYFIENSECVNRVTRPITTEEERKNQLKLSIKNWSENNVEKIKINRLNYYENNKEKISELKNEYREINKEKIAINKKKYREINKQELAVSNKHYRDTHKEEMSESGKRYYANNKKKVFEQQKIRCAIKFTCCCGSNCNVAKQSRHEKSKKHIQYIYNLNLI